MDQLETVRSPEDRQMPEVEFTADLMGLLLEGVQARRQPTIEKLYKTYDEDLQDQDQITEHFTRTFDFLDEVFKPGGTQAPLRRFRSNSWIYTCFAVASGADHFKLDGSLRKGMTEVELPTSPSDLAAALDQTEVALRDDKLDPEVAKRLRGATSDRSSRVERIRFLRSFL